MKINYFELKVVDSGTNLPELKHSPKRQTNAHPHIYQAALPMFCDSEGSASFPRADGADVFRNVPQCSVCMWPVLGGKQKANGTSGRGST